MPEYPVPNQVTQQVVLSVSELKMLIEASHKVTLFTAELHFSNSALWE